MSKQSTAASKKAAEQERLDAQVNLNGVGEDQVIKDLLSDKFVKGTNQEASEIGMALRQLISGQSTLLSNMERQSAEMEKIRQRMAEMDKTAEKWEADKVRFTQEVMDKAESLRTQDPDKFIAKGSIQLQNAITQARAELATDRMSFHEQLARMPKELVISPGELVTVMEGGRPVNKMYPEVIRIKGEVWTLQPGVPTEVPFVVGEALRNKRRSEEETRAREHLMSQNLEREKVEQEWAKLNSKFKSPTG
jgi:hypothetical protein